VCALPRGTDARSDEQSEHDRDENSNPAAPMTPDDLHPLPRERVAKHK